MQRVPERTWLGQADMLTSMSFVFHEYSSDSRIHPCGAQLGQACGCCCCCCCCCWNTELYPRGGPLNNRWSFSHERHRSRTCPYCDPPPPAGAHHLLGSGTRELPVISAPLCRCPLQRRANGCCSGCRRLANGTGCRNGAFAPRWEGWGKPRPLAVALCAVIGELSKGDCTTDGHLQATMIPFVPFLPPLDIQLLYSCFPSRRSWFMNS